MIPAAWIVGVCGVWALLLGGCALFEKMIDRAIARRRRNQ